MDLNNVIAELRAELESVNEVTAALEKLMEIRHSGPEAVKETGSRGRPSGKSKKQKNSADEGIL